MDSSFFFFFPAGVDFNSGKHSCLQSSFQSALLLPQPSTQLHAGWVTDAAPSLKGTMSF